MSLLPVAAMVLLVGAGLVAGFVFGPSVADRLVEGEGGLRSLWRLGARIAMLLAGVAAGLGLSLVLTAPFQDLLSKRVEQDVRGSVEEASRGFRWEVSQFFRGALYFLVRAPLIPILALVPIVGPGLALLWAGHTVAFQQTDPTLGRRGLDFDTRRQWHRRYRFESLGFGFASMVALVVPIANLLVLPTLVIGGTRLALARLDVD